MNETKWKCKNLDIWVDEDGDDDSLFMLACRDTSGEVEPGVSITGLSKIEARRIYEFLKENLD